MSNEKFSRHKFLKRLTQTAALLSVTSALELALSGCNSDNGMANSDNGPVIVHPKVSLLFMGIEEWSSSPKLIELIDRMTGIMEAVVSDSMYVTLEKSYKFDSGYIDRITLSEFGKISPSWKQSSFDSSGFFTGTFGDFDSAVSEFIETGIKDKTLPPDNMFMLYFPPGFPTPAIYHLYTQELKIPYCILPYASNPAGKTPAMDAKDAIYGGINGSNTMSRMSSDAVHEFYEAITDPTFQSWKDQGQEAGDLCSNNIIYIKTKDGLVPVQSIFNPDTQKCYPDNGATISDINVQNQTANVQANSLCPNIPLEATIPALAAGLLIQRLQQFFAIRGNELNRREQKRPKKLDLGRPH